MQNNILSLPAGLHVRPSKASDERFLLSLYKSTRNDLNLIDAEQEWIEELKLNQYQAQTNSYATNFPNAMSLIIEYYDQKVGRVILDFGHNEILLVDISFISEGRGKGLGRSVMNSLIHCSEQSSIPLKLSVLNENTAAKRFYQRLGFVPVENRYPREYLTYFPSSQTVRVNA